MNQQADNALLNLSFELPFDRISAEDVEPAVGVLLKEAQAALHAIGEVRSSERTYEDTLRALEQATERLELAMGVVGHLESVATSDALREAYNAVRPGVSELYSSIALDENLYAAIRAFADTDEASKLSPTRRRFLDKTLREFRRYGAELDPAGKEKLKSIDVELSKLTTTYAQNLLDETNAFELLIEDEDKLAGLPQSARAQARASAEEKELAGYRFTLQAPSLIPLLKYLDDGSIRHEVWEAYNKRASAGERNNRVLIAQILDLRKQKAKLLGYEDFADFSLEERMAHKGATAISFVSDLSARTRPFFDRDIADLVAFRKQLEGPSAPAPEAWDMAYYSEKERRALYDLDEEEVRAYFPADSVLQGLFSVVQRLYGVQVQPWEGASVWDDSVKTYRLIDEAGRHLGSFYVDLYPRENKRGGAWMNSFITGGPRSDGFSPHLGLFCANVTPPVGDTPALLNHREVETLFHEFGHLMHHCLSEVEVRSLAGTQVAWDFVELPSQIMENWTWEREALDLFAHHHETGATLPQDLFDKMLAARNYRSASAMMRQLGFAHTDLALHVAYDPEVDGDPVDYARKQVQPYTAAALPEDYAMICGFGHLFASPVGYAAGYYSYKWAEVLDADAFSRFAKEGIFNPEVGAAFRQSVLSRGDSDDPGVLFRAFMGRDAKVDALMERSGLV